MSASPGTPLTRTECNFLSWLKRGHALQRMGDLIRCGFSTWTGTDTTDRLVALGLVENDGDQLIVTDAGRHADLFRGRTR